jgi:cytochrome d ubiquinol oxidase subunit II
MLETIWFFLWGLLWAVYFMLDGFDLGMGTLLPFLARTDTEKRMIFNAAGPYWDGNEVWLITAGGVTFAAFPLVYAVMFSALYAPLLIILFALILRAVSFEFRAQSEHPLWKLACDTAQFLGSFVPALLFGVAFANLFMGIPIDGEGIYHGNILKLLNIYGLAGGIFFLLMFCLHGSLWMALKTPDPLAERALATARRLWPVLTVVAVLFLVLSAFYTDLYANYMQCLWLWAIPVLAVLFLFGIRFCLHGYAVLSAWVCSALFIVAVTFFGVTGMFPGMLISNMSADFTLTAFNAASSQLTLTIMLCVVCVAVPVVIAYQAWAYHLFAQKVTEKELQTEYSY